MDSIKIILSLIGNFSEIILSVLFFFIIRIFLPIDVIGYYGSITSFLTTLSFILDLGFSTAHLKFYSEAHEKHHKAKCNSSFLIYRIIQLMIYITVIYILIQITPVYPQNIFVIYLFLIAYLFRISASYIFSYFLISKKLVFKNSLSLIISGILKNLLFILLTLYFYSDIWILGNILLISNLTYFFIILLYVRKTNFKKPSKKVMSQYLKYSAPFFLITTITITTTNIDVLFVNIWFPVSEVGNFFTAKQIFNYFVIFAVSISQILISTFSRNLSNKENWKNLSIVEDIHRYLNLIITPIVFLIILFLDEVIIFIFGPEYYLTGHILAILAIDLIFISIDHGNRILLMALGKIKFLAVFYSLEGAIDIILLILFISPQFLGMGAIGAALAFILTKLIIQIIYRPIIFKKFGLKFYFGSFRNFAIMFFVSLLQFGINHLFSYSILFIPLFILFELILFFGISYLLKGFTKGDIKIIFSILNPKNFKKSIVSEFRDKI
jgi:O-antigen/teichoic acid export membrane protein